MKKILYLILLIAIFIDIKLFIPNAIFPIKAKNKQVLIIGCSNKTISDILFVKDILNNENYLLPYIISCDNKSAKIIYEMLEDNNFDNIDGFCIVTMNYIYIREKNATESIPYLLLHESGHYNHFLKTGILGYNKIGKKPIPNKLIIKIWKEVSFYATTSRYEFVAEYFVKKHLGKKFSKEINNFYKECKGE